MGHAEVEGEPLHGALALVEQHCLAWAADEIFDFALLVLKLRFSELRAHAEYAVHGRTDLVADSG